MWSVEGTRISGNTVCAMVESLGYPEVVVLVGGPVTVDVTLERKSFRALHSTFRPDLTSFDGGLC